MTPFRRWPRKCDWLLPRLDAFAARLGLRLTRREFDELHVPDWQRDIISKVRPFTATDALAIAGLLDAIAYLGERTIPGDIVECGVWHGGSVMAAAFGLLRAPTVERKLWLYDTFEGMTEPSSSDVRLRDGLKAEDIYDAEVTLPEFAKSEWFWVRAALEVVQENIARTGYPPDLFRFVPGRVEDTIPAVMPESIALLRLDTDWYASTKHELEYLIPRLSPGGVLIIDDYHYWRGSRQAVDEYFAASGTRPLLSRIGRCAVMTTL